MTHRLFILFSFLFFCLSFLNPVHSLPWAGSFSEISVFIATLLLLPLFFTKQLKLPIITLPFFTIAILPLIQYAFGQIFFFSNAGLSAIYLFCFWLALIIGYNFSQNEGKADLNFNLTQFLAWFLLACGIISSLFALLQWLNLSYNIPIIMGFSGSRPYANVAQPNHLGTLLNLAIFSGWYLYEKEKIRSPLFLMSILFLVFAIALTQSRTGYLIFLLGIICLFIFKRKLNLKVCYANLFVSTIYFITIVVFLPKITLFLSRYFDIQQATSVIERATTGFERFKIWNQMIHAIINHPWFGYGWNQTTSAQFSVIDTYHGREWATSSHNFFLDILVWCGLPIGILIIVFIIWLYVGFLKNIVSIEKLFAFLIISALGFHSLLEYPLYYSYFLIPLGLFFGLAISKSNIKSFQISGKYLIIVWLGGALILVGVCRDYFKVEDNLFAGRLHAMGDLRSEVDLPYHLYFLDNFETRAKWLGLYPKIPVEKQKLEDAKKIINTSLKPYDIHKYGQLMAYNDNKREALRMLRILKIMYGMNISYDELINDRIADSDTGNK